MTVFVSECGTGVIAAELRSSVMDLEDDSLSEQALALPPLSAVGNVQHLQGHEYFAELRAAAGIRAAFAADSGNEVERSTCCPGCPVAGEGRDRLRVTNVSRRLP